MWFRPHANILVNLEAAVQSLGPTRTMCLTDRLALNLGATTNPPCDDGCHVMCSSKTQRFHYAQLHGNEHCTCMRSHGLPAARLPLIGSFMKA
jgi:hypothetical protein